MKNSEIALKPATDVVQIVFNECEKHAGHMNHCRVCAESCRKCAEACKSNIKINVIS